MFAIIKQDRIIKIGGDAGVDIGSIPKGLGLDQCRFDGTKLIDITKLNKFWVEPGTHILHVIPIPGSQLISMNWSDRRHLIDIDGVIRVKTQAEIDKPKLEEYKAKRAQVYPSLGDQLGAILEYLSLSENLPKELQDIIDKIIQIKEEFPKGV